MAHPFYDKAGSLISPGDIFDRLPYTRIPKPLRIARKFSGSLPKGVSVRGSFGRSSNMDETASIPPPTSSLPVKMYSPTRKWLKRSF